MNTTPDFPNEAWNALRARAAAQLPGDFADRVLRALRRPAYTARDMAERFFVAACTATACLLLVLLINAHYTHDKNQIALADWQQKISAQADSIAAVP